MNSDVLNLEILEDGTIKTTSDAVSAPNHASAEAFLKLVGRLAGGTVKRERRRDAMHHHHEHEHVHEGN
jgi:hypothetical protein